MYKIKPLSGIKKEITVPADKSISHRAVIISSLTKAKTKISPFLFSRDTLATVSCLRRLGVDIKLFKDSVLVEGAGPYFPKTGKIRLSARESGTTMRILSGLLAGQKFPVIFSADLSLRKRPMKRITAPLREMGADIKGVIIANEEYPPLSINPASGIKAVNYRLPVPSAQVKSCLFLASLYAKGESKIIESVYSRDHTERMLSLFKAGVKIRGKAILISPARLRSPKNIFIPSDFSSAAFFIALGLTIKDSEILIKDVNINPTRCGLLLVLKRMRADIRVINKKGGYEPYADIIIKSSSLLATQVKEREIPLMIDEIPILCSIASFAKGTTVIWGLRELKVKETDRVTSMVYNLKSAGVKISAERYFKKGKEDWCLIIIGRKKFKRAHFKSFSDHRTTMSMVVFGMASRNTCTIDDIKCINKSFPGFIPLISSLR